MASEKHYNDMKEALEAKGCQIIAIEKKSVPMHFICICGTEKKQMYKDFKRRQCRGCKNKKTACETNVQDEEYTETNGEVWKRIDGGWISSFGRAKSVSGNLLSLCPTKYRYFMNKHHQYASRLVAIAFKIEHYEKLIEATNSWCVIHIDDDPSNNHVSNLKVVSKSEIGMKNGKKSRKSDNFQDELSKQLENYTLISSKKIPELPHYTLFQTGEIYNGLRFVTGSVSNKKYLQICMTEKTYKIHRLICYAFNPIEGNSSLNDYKDLQVNHIDGNTFNNHANNLEWTTQSQNIQHAYDSGLNKKLKTVVQFDLQTREKIAEFPSIAKASRETGEREHCIRDCAKKNKIYTSTKYFWKLKSEC